jgi:hypothetical protein
MPDCRSAISYRRTANAEVIQIIYIGALLSGIKRNLYHDKRFIYLVSSNIASTPCPIPDLQSATEEPQMLR